MKLAQKRGRDMAKLREAILLLIEGRLLIYKIDGDNLHFVRTGTHSDLF